MSIPSRTCSSAWDCKSTPPLGWAISVTCSQNNSRSGCRMHPSLFSTPSYLSTRSVKWPLFALGGLRGCPGRVTHPPPPSLGRVTVRHPTSTAKPHSPSLNRNTLPTTAPTTHYTTPHHTTPTTHHARPARSHRHVRPLRKPP